MALCALAQLFIVVTYPPLVRLLVLETLGSGNAQGSCSAEAAAAHAAAPSSTAIEKGATVGGVWTARGTGSSAPLLALLQGDREELCLGALVVLQASARNAQHEANCTAVHFTCTLPPGGFFSLLFFEPDAARSA